jgi:hypothetical protein
MSAIGLFFSRPLSSGVCQGTFAVAEYRAYTVGHDENFIGFYSLVCADDAEAIEKAKRLVDGHDVELWNGLRFVIRLSRKPE